MKITVEFDNLQEINDFCNGVLIAPGLAQAAREENAQPAQEPVKETKAKKSTPKKEEAQEEAKTEAAEAPAEDPVKETPAKEDEPAAGQHSEGDLKLLLSDKLKKGKKAEVKKLFEKYGVSCLTDLIAKEKDNIDAVYAEAEVI